MDKKMLVNRIARQLAGDYDWRGVISVTAVSGLKRAVNLEMKRLGYRLGCEERRMTKRYDDDPQESIYNPAGN